MAYENMGNEQLVYFSFAKKTIIVRRSAQTDLELTEKKGIIFLKNKIVYFDENNGDVIL